MAEQPKKPLDTNIISNDGKLLYCPCQAKPWKRRLATLYAEFRTEDSREPPSDIIPFDNERIIRFLVGNGSRSLEDAGFAAYGMATLVLANHGTGARYVGHVEDVFVSRDFRRQGIGESLMRALIAEAKRRDVISLWLTSNPRRIPAHRLYEKLGFARLAKPDEDRDHATNFYMLSLRPI